LTTNVPSKPERLESQIPVEEEYPTHVPARFIRGAAQERHCDVEGPVQVLQAGEQLSVSLIAVASEGGRRPYLEHVEEEESQY